MPSKSENDVKKGWQQLEKGFFLEKYLANRYPEFCQFVFDQLTFDQNIHEFLKVPEINRLGRINTEWEAYAAELVLYKFRRDLQLAGQEAFLDNPIILGIKNSGTHFAEAVHRNLGLNKKQLLEVYKYDPEREIIPTDDPCVMQAESYSAGENKSFRVPLAEIYKLMTKSSGILVVDDFMAKGKVMGALAEFVEQWGLKVRGGLVYASKEWQGGVKELKAFGVPVYRALPIIQVIGEGDNRTIEIEQFTGSPIVDSPNMRRANSDPFQVPPYDESRLLVNANGQPISNLERLYRVGNRNGH